MPRWICVPTYLLMDVERGKWYWRVGMVRAVSVPICFPSYSNTLHTPPPPSTSPPLSHQSILRLCVDCVLYSSGGCSVLCSILYCYCPNQTATAHIILLLRIPYWYFLHHTATLFSPYSCCAGQYNYCTPHTATALSILLLCIRTCIGPRRIRCDDVVFRFVKIVSHVQEYGLESVGCGKGWGQWLFGTEAVDSQHGTRVERCSVPCTEGHHPK